MTCLYFVQWVIGISSVMFNWFTRTLELSYVILSTTSGKWTQQSVIRYGLSHFVECLDQ